MNRALSEQVNPLVRLARRLPAGVGRMAALGGRLAGGVFATVLAVDQSYEGTRVFAGAVAALVLLSCLPISGRFRGWLPWIGAGLLFFGGAVLAGFTAGQVMILCGAIAAAGAAIDEQQQRRTTGVPAFFAGFVLTFALVVVTVLVIEG